MSLEQTRLMSARSNSELLCKLVKRTGSPSAQASTQPCLIHQFWSCVPRLVPKSPAKLPTSILMPSGYRGAPAIFASQYRKISSEVILKCLGAAIRPNMVLSHRNMVELSATSSTVLRPWSEPLKGCAPQVAGRSIICPDGYA